MVQAGDTVLIGCSGRRPQNRFGGEFSRSLQHMRQTSQLGSDGARFFSVFH
jgi:hypothetical protein